MPIKYIPYYPDTVEGQAILDNITRTQRVLRYRENNKVYDRIKRGMPYYEVAPIETVGNPSDNLVIRGECISACAYLKEKGIKVDLVYIDPPFASGADYAKKVFLRRNPKLAKELATVQEEVDANISALETAEQDTGVDMSSEIQLVLNKLTSFEDKMYGDIWKKEDYLSWMYENLTAIKSIMSETGSIYVHLDAKIGHYVKVLLDEIFGEDNFLNEIIWRYPNKMSGAVNSRSFVKVHDTIFVYTYSQDNVFNVVKIERDEPVQQSKRIKVDGKNMRARDKNGNIIYELSLDTKANDVWDIPYIASTDTQRLDYATQKPEALLERAIKASSNKDMVVADLFGGSGVTAKIANDLGRKFIHVDVGINSIQTVRDRLIQYNANFQILEIQDGVSLFRNPQQTMDKLATLIPGLQKSVRGINKFWFGAIISTKDGTVPVYVPDLINSQKKILNTDDYLIYTILNKELDELEIEVKKVIVYYIDIEDRGKLEKFIRDNNATEIEVELKDLKNLLHEVVIEDVVDYKTEKTEVGYEIEISKFASDRLIQKIGEFNQKGNLQSLTKGKEFEPINISEEGLELIELIALDCQNTEGQWHSSTEIKIDKLGYMIIDGIKTKEFWDGKIKSELEPKRLKIRNISGDETIISI